MGERCVVGIDSGGSHTRALCVAPDGRVLGSATAGGGSPRHNADAGENVRGAIRSALRSAGASAADVIGLVAGMAGVENESDRVWAEEFIELSCPRHLVNDAIVAHAGAFAGGPGVIVVAGTGSMILAITEAGEEIRNQRYHHYAGGARHLAFHALTRILIDEDTEADSSFLAEIYRYWSAADKHALRRAVAAMESADYNEVKRFYGAMARLVTGMAESSPLASESCWWLVRATCVGARLMAAHVGTAPVLVALEGGLATSPVFTDRISGELADSSGGRIRVRPAILSPVAGAAMMALQRAGITVDAELLGRLAAPAVAQPA